MVQGQERAAARDRGQAATRECLAQPASELRPEERVGQFTVPVRVLWGEADPFFRTELGRRLSEAFPGGSLATVPGGRTFLPLDHPGEVAREITAAARDASPQKA